VSDLAPRTRRQWQVSLNQNLPGAWGDLFLSASVHDRWHSDNSVTQLQGGYTNQLRIGRTRLSYGISIARQEDMFSGEHDKRVQMNFSLPVGNAAHAPALATSFVQETRRGERRRGSQQVLIGSLGDSHQLSYSLAGSQTGGDSAYTANGQYRGAKSSVSASLSKGSSYAQQSLGATGGLVIHHGGLTLANQMTDTFGIVEAKGAEGARVTNSVGTSVNRSGYAIIPFLLPYRMNNISIDPAGAVSPDVEFQSTSALVAPRLNSVVLIRFETVEGRAILITARTPEGSEVPFGASVFDARGGEVGLVGQSGRIYLRGIAESGTLTARWGDGRDDQCSFAYQVPSNGADSDAFVRLDADCRTVAEPEARQQ
jgi:outer membrane usher protein